MYSVAIGASIACSGVCLTVVEKGPDWFAVDVSGESLSRTAPDMWAKGARLNLERALRVGDELGGHIVTGHVDGIGRLISATQEGDSTRSEEHTSELQSLMRKSYAVFCLKKKKTDRRADSDHRHT